MFDVDSLEARDGNSLSNSTEANFALHLFTSLMNELGSTLLPLINVITPYSQQVTLIRRTFSQALGHRFDQRVEVNSVDSFQGRESSIIIFSCVRASGSKGIGFLSDVRRMNVALTRAKHFLFIIARCQTIISNPFWRDLVEHARERRAMIPVHVQNRSKNNYLFPNLCSMEPVRQLPKQIIPLSKTKANTSQLTLFDDMDVLEEGEI
jgi:senataxin